MKNLAARMGRYTLESWGDLRYLAAVIWATFWVSAQRRCWVRTVRHQLTRQIYSGGVQSSRFVAYVSVALGVSVVAQALVWMQKIGQTRVLGPLLVTVLIREAVPVLTNLLVIARNGTALTTELGNMKVSGEVRVLDAQGLDPFVYLVMPRILGLVIAVFCLNILLLAGSIASGYLFGALLIPNIDNAGTFVHSILVSVSPLDLVNFLAKALLPALLTGAISCSEGLGAGPSVNDVPRATRRALGRSVRALFLTSALVSLLTYI